MELKKKRIYIYLFSNSTGFKGFTMICMWFYDGFEWALRVLHVFNVSRQFFVGKQCKFNDFDSLCLASGFGVI